MFVDDIQKNNWIGVEETSDKPRRLQAGRLGVDFVSGRLTNISSNGKNVIDEVYFALRDYNWGTIPYRIENLVITEQAEAFSVSFTAVHDQEPMQFTWKAQITGTADSTVTYAFEGTAQSDFMKNRIGFCVLHPASCGGVSCDIEHFSAETESGAFPMEISPHQPFIDIKAIIHYPAKGVAVRTQFEGDVFEMEDQRNWTDASFKTYCTPLSLPFPAPVKKGDTFHQSVTISLRTEQDKEEASASDGGTAISLKAAAARKGSGFSLGSCITRPLSDLQLQRVKALELSQLRFDYHFNDPSEHFGKIFEQARMLGLPVQLAVFFTDSWKEELETLRGIVNENEASIMGVAVFQQDVKVVSKELLAAVRDALMGCLVPVGSGTDAFFTQINRERLPESLLDFVTYSSNPQVHAFDNASIMSTVEGQNATILSCERMYPHLPVWISPVSLKMRWNPDATGKDIVKKGQAPRDVDNRQMSLFAASWFLRSAAACLNSGAAGANYFELVGCKGIMEEQAPERDYAFPAFPDMLYPLYYAFYALRGLSAFDISASVMPDMTVFILRNEAQKRLILANPKNEAVTLRLADAPALVHGVMLDENTMPALAQRKGIEADDDCWQTYNLNGEIRMNPYSIFIAEL